MAVPTIREIKGAILRFLAKGQVPDQQDNFNEDRLEYSRQDIFNAIAGSGYLNLAAEELAERLPSGRTKFENRSGTALTNLSQAGLVESLGGARWQITPHGIERTPPSTIPTLPAPEQVRDAILKLEFPAEGIRVKDAVVILADKFQLSDEQRNAEDRHGLNVFRYATVAPAFRYLLQNGRLTQPRGPRKPYVLGPDSSLPIPEPDPPIPEPDPSVSFEETAREIQEELEANLLRKDGKLWVALPYHIEELEANLLRKVKGIHPTFFEKLVINLLEKMGYGAGEVLGGSRDDGIDGIITDDDRLELYRIYVQAKRWKKEKVGKPDIQQFAGALLEQDATMGIFVTTSVFTGPAIEYGERKGSPRIVLVDGKELARLLLEYNVFHG